MLTLTGTFLLIIKHEKPIETIMSSVCEDKYLRIVASQTTVGSAWASKDERWTSSFTMFTSNIKKLVCIVCNCRLFTWRGYLLVNLGGEGASGELLLLTISVYAVACAHISTTVLVWP